MKILVQIMRNFQHFKDTSSAIHYVCILFLAWIPQVLTKVSPFILREMKYFKIIPDLVDEAPPFGCQIDYGKECADFGNIVMPHQVEEEPKETFWPTDRGKFYTLIMVGLDEPSPKYPVLREFLHWLVVNIPEDKFDFGVFLAPYIRPNVKDEEEHRFAFLVFEQPRGETKFDIITTKADHSDNLREKFSWRSFAEKHGLGKPYAINFFRAEKAGPMDKTSKKSGSDDDGSWFNF